MCNILVKIFLNPKPTTSREGWGAVDFIPVGLGFKEFSNQFVFLHLNADIYIVFYPAF